MALAEAARVTGDVEMEVFSWRSIGVEEPADKIFIAGLGDPETELQSIAEQWLPGAARSTFRVSKWLSNCEPLTVAWEELHEICPQAKMKR